MATKPATKKTATKKTEVAVVEEEDNAMAVTNLPSFMEEGDKGTEDLGSDDVQLPWLKLLQGTTPGLHEKGLRQGNFFHSIIEEELDGDEGLDIVVILALKPRYMLFNPLDQGGGILARAEDGVHWEPANHTFEVKLDKGKTTVHWRTANTVAASGLAKWGSTDPSDPKSPPAADLQYRYICVAKDRPDLGAFMISLQRSGIKAAKHLNSLLKGCKAVSYGQVFHISSEWEDQGDTDKKFIWKFKRAGLVRSEDEYLAYQSMYEQFQDADVKIHDEESMASADTASDIEATGTVDLGPDSGKPEEY